MWREAVRGVEGKEVGEKRWVGKEMKKDERKDEWGRNMLEREREKEKSKSHFKFQSQGLNTKLGEGHYTHTS